MLGSLVPLMVQTVNNALTPTVPTRCPHADIFTNGGTKVASILMPVIDKGGQTGLFLYQLSLDSRFSTGSHIVVYHYRLSTTPYVAQAAFRIVAGGHAEGSAEALAVLRIPQAEFVLMHTDGGRAIRQRNPRLSS